MAKERPLEMRTDDDSRTNSPAERSSHRGGDRHMIRKLGRTARNAVLESVGRAASHYQERTPLPVDLLESDDAYLAVFDAPGVVPADVDVRFDRDTIHVSLERFREFHEGFEMRAPGRGMTLTGSITLPDDAAVDATAANAVLTEVGTLEVRVPKTGDRHTQIDAETETDNAVDVESEPGEPAANDGAYEDVR